MYFDLLFFILFRLFFYFSINKRDIKKPNLKLSTNSKKNHKQIKNKNKKRRKKRKMKETPKAEKNYQRKRHKKK